jgi:hypothetical protein
VGTGSYFTATSLVATDSFKRYKGIMPATTAVEYTSGVSATAPYPNPVTDYLNIDYGNKSLTISVNDITGRTVRIFSGIYNQLYLGDLENGTYIIKISNNEFTRSIKVLKE